MDIEKTRQVVTGGLKQAKRPAVLWSGGKDSQVLLHFVLEQKPDIEVLYFRALSHATKHTFVNEQIRSRHLNIVYPLASWRDFIAKGQHVQLIEVFQLTPISNIHFPVESLPDYQPTADSHCAIEAYNQPTATEAWPYDVLFIGHRGDDADDFWGRIGAQEYTAQLDTATMVYPLRDWTEADIWEQSKALNIPQNEARYFAQDMSQNNDYYDMCTRCLQPSGKKFVTCPKDGLPILNVSQFVNLEESRQQWRKTFLNVEAA